MELVYTPSTDYFPIQINFQIIHYNHLKLSPIPSIQKEPALHTASGLNLLSTTTLLML